MSVEMHGAQCVCVRACARACVCVCARVGVCVWMAWQQWRWTTRTKTFPLANVFVCRGPQNSPPGAQKRISLNPIWQTCKKKTPLQNLVSPPICGSVCSPFQSTAARQQRCTWAGRLPQRGGGGGGDGGVNTERGPGARSAHGLRRSLCSR